jgi:CheY-like chemotaxis protein
VNKQPHILLADDDFEDRFLMADTFKELNYGDVISFVEDGVSLLEFLENSDLTIGLIVLDLNMPRLNGTETLRILKNDDRFRHIPVIIFSTSVNEIERAVCLELGARDYFTKPARYNAYMDVCRSLYNISQEVSVTC